jgi:hypothetical protein
MTSEITIGDAVLTEEQVATLVRGLQSYKNRLFTLYSGNSDLPFLLHEVNAVKALEKMIYPPPSAQEKQELTRLIAKTPHAP